MPRFKRVKITVLSALFDLEPDALCNGDLFYPRIFEQRWYARSLMAARPDEFQILDEGFLLAIFPNEICGLHLRKLPPRGPCLRVTGVAHPGFPMLVLYLLSLAHRSATRLWGPGVGCRWQRPDHLLIAEPKGKVEWPPWYKTQAVVLPRQRVEPPGTKPGLWSH